MSTVIFYPKLEPSREFHYMPLSALAVASKLVSSGERTAIIDDRVIQNSEEVLLSILRNELFGSVPRGMSGIDVPPVKLMMSVYTGYQVARAYEVAKLVRARLPHVMISWGGPHVSAMPMQTLEDPYVDGIHEGYFERGENLIPWDLINVMDYVNPLTKRFIYVTSYACPGICSFCQTRNVRPYIELPLQKVIADIANLMRLYDFKECVFFDATLFSNRERAAQLSSVMLHHKLEWIADARAVEIVKMTQEYLDMLVASGLKQLTIGLESGSDRIVQQMKKGKKHLEIFEQCARMLRATKIKMVSGVIFGCPGETPDDIKLTIEYIKRIKQLNPNFYISTTFFMPLPDTLMNDDAKQYGHTEPSSLQGWADLGSNNHFKYNSWMNNPWIIDKDEYKKIYDEFISTCDYLI